MARDIRPSAITRTGARTASPWHDCDRSTATRARLAGLVSAVVAAWQAGANPHLSQLVCRTVARCALAGHAAAATTCRLRTARRRQPCHRSHLAAVLPGRAARPCRTGRLPCAGANTRPQQHPHRPAQRPQQTHRADPGRCRRRAGAVCCAICRHLSSYGMLRAAQRLAAATAGRPPAAAGCRAGAGFCISRQLPGIRLRIGTSRHRPRLERRSRCPDDAKKRTTQIQ